MNEKDIFEVIKELRQRSGMTAKEVAKKANTTQANISNIEAGKRKQTTYDMLERILNAMGYEFNVTPKL